MVELQILKSHFQCTQKNVAKKKQKKKWKWKCMFLTRKNQLRKQLFQTMDGELDMVEALGLCATALRRPRKEQGANYRMI
mgnify:CR=1 FL=1